MRQRVAVQGGARNTYARGRGRHGHDSGEDSGRIGEAGARALVDTGQLKRARRHRNAASVASAKSEGNARRAALRDGGRVHRPGAISRVRACDTCVRRDGRPRGEQTSGERPRQATTQRRAAQRRAAAEHRQRGRAFWDEAGGPVVRAPSQSSPIQSDADRRGGGSPTA